MERKRKYRFYNLLGGIGLSLVLVLIISCNGPLEFQGYHAFQAPEFTKANTGPYLIKTSHLDLIDSLKNDDPVLSRELEKLINGADSLLNVQFEYVPDDNHIPPSGDTHDYLSIHRYSYPDSTGAYSNQIDGKTNPEFYEYDKPKLEKISAGIYTLSLAYYYTKDEKYALKASKELQNWFFDPATRMNPNLKFSSVRPGVDESEGGAGIVGALDFISIIEGVSLLYESNTWTPEHHFKLKEWFYDFYTWMWNRYPTDAYEHSNISTWLDLQRGVYLSFLEMEDELSSDSHIQPIAQRLSIQIENDGLLPNEKSRSISQSYVFFNLKAYMQLSILRKNHFLETGNDRDWPVLKTCALDTCDYGGLKITLENLAEFVLNGTQINLFSEEQNFNRCRYLEIFRPAALAFESMMYEDVVQQLVNEGCRNSNILLVYPSPEKL